MTADAGAVAAAITQLEARLTAEAAERPLSKTEQLVLRLNKQYPLDVGEPRQ
jgi:hypothetical protein